MNESAGVDATSGGEMSGGRMSTLRFEEVGPGIPRSRSLVNLQDPEEILAELPALE